MNKDPLQVLKGTTTMGLICNDGVVVATDTRVTMGNIVAHKKGKKAFKIDEHLVMTIAGVVADAQNVVDILKVNAKLYRLKKGKPFPVKSLARLASNILFSSRMYPLVLQAVIGGIDDTGSHLFGLDPLGSVTEEEYISTGSGSPIAYGVLEAGYREDLTVQQGISLVIESVWSAMKRDIGSGDSFDIVTVTKEGYKELSSSEKNAFLKA
jgi:proteasome beta subunit